jgi:competence protein ComFC
MLYLWNILLEKILHPRFCIFCRKEKVYICADCESKIERKKNALEYLNFYSKYDYRDKNIKKILFKIKYHNNKYLAREIGGIYSDFMLEKNTKNDGNFIIIPVPISSKRFEERGYNQAKEIAIGITCALKNIEICEAVTKIKHTEKLFKKENKEERSIELRDAFGINKAEFAKIRNKNIIILDDITTSGTTFFAIKNLLVQNHIPRENIYCFALAN